MRLTLAMRVTLIVLVSLAVVWIVALAVYYRSHAADVMVRPAPARLAALAALIESSAPAERPLILEAATSAIFRPSLSVSPPQPGPPQAGAAIERIRRSYAEALGGRPVEITAVTRTPLSRLFPRLAPARENALRFRIGLRAGGTLVVDTRSPIMVTRTGLPVGLGAGLFGTLVAMIALYVMHRETKPLARLAAAVDRVDLSIDSAELPQPRRSAPEIRAVIAAFNRLQSRLGAMLRARMALIGGISHDVRTFATRLRLRVDGIADHDERRRAVADIDDMIRLLDDALLSSRAGAGELELEMVEFAELVAAEVADQSAGGDAVALVVAEEARRSVVLGDRVALRRIVTNIIHNAVKYGRAAHVRLGGAKGSVVLQVDDEGPGIPAAQREFLLQPFSRLESSRNRGTGGAGLGLAVVQALVEAHEGSVEIGETPEGHGRVTVRLRTFVPGRDALPSAS